MSFRFSFPNLANSCASLSALAVLLCLGSYCRGDDLFEVRAQLVAKRHATLAAQVSSRLESLPFSEGSSFVKGDRLAIFDDALQLAQLHRAEAELAAAQYTAQANRRLRELNSIGQVELEISLAAVDKASADYEYIEAMIERCKLLAPFDGRVAEILVQEKEFAQTGQPVLTILSDGVPEVEFLAPSRWLKWIEVGDEMVLSIDETERSYAARVSRIGARVDAVSQTVMIRAELVDTPAELIPGMSGVVKMTSENAK